MKPRLHVPFMSHCLLHATHLFKIYGHLMKAMSLSEIPSKWPCGFWDSRAVFYSHTEHLLNEIQTWCKDLTAPALQDTHGRGIHGPMSLHETLPLARSLKNIIKTHTFDTRLLPFQRVIFSDRTLYAQGKAKEKLFCGSCLSTVLCSQYYKV